MTGPHPPTMIPEIPTYVTFSANATGAFFAKNKRAPGYGAGCISPFVVCFKMGPYRSNLECVKNKINGRRERLLEIIDFNRPVTQSRLLLFYISSFI